MFRAFEDGIVYLELQGACVGCPESLNTVRYGVEVVGTNVLLMADRMPTRSHLAHPPFTPSLLTLLPVSEHADALCAFGTMHLATRIHLSVNHPYLYPMSSLPYVTHAPRLACAVPPQVDGVEEYKDDYFREMEAQMSSTAPGTTS